MKIMRAWILLLSIASFAIAQPLAEHVPDSALLYFGWRGSDNPGSGFAGSHAEAIATESQITTRWAEAFNGAIDQTKAQFPKGSAELDAFRMITPLVCRHSGAFFVDATTADKKIDFRAAMLIDAGGDAKQLKTSLETLLANRPKDAPVSIAEAGGKVVLAVNFSPEQISALTSTATAKSLATSARFKAANAKLVKEPVVLIYADVDNLRACLLASIGTFGKPNEMALVQKGLDESGLSGVHSFAMAGGFANQKWEETTFLDAPSPRKGLLTLLEAKPFSGDLLKRIPANSTSYTAARFDLMKLLVEIKRITTSLSPEAGDMVNKGIGAATLAIGKNLETDIFDPLGSEWGVYRSKDIGPDPLSQMVLVSKLDNGFKAKQGLGALWLFMTNTANAFVPKDKFYFKSEILKDAELSIYSLKLTGFAPSWTTKDGYLYAGFDPKTVATAARYAGPGIGENAAVTEFLKSIAPPDVLSVSYSDVPADLPAGYEAILVSLDRVRTLINEQAKPLIGKDVYFPRNDQLLPPVEVLKKHLSPGASVSWSDDAGFHARTVDAFPGATTIANQVSSQAIGDALNKTIQPTIQALQRQNQRVPTSQP